jgi:hypothetical protein
MNATAMRGTDEGIETVRGKIEQLRLVDGAVRAYIGGKAYYLYELTELSETEEAEAAGETSTP